MPEVIVTIEPGVDIVAVLTPDEVIIYRAAAAVQAAIADAEAFAEDSATSATASEEAAETAIANANLTAADVVTVANNLAATNQDTIDTAADLAATLQDTIDTAADLLATNADVESTNADVASTNADAVSTASDARDTGIDAAATGEDATQTALDVISTGEDVTATNANVAATNTDAAQTAVNAVASSRDVAATNADVVSTNDDAASTANDVRATNADVVTTGNNVTATNADAATTNADATQTALDRTATSNNAAATNADVVSTNTIKQAVEAIFDNFDDKYLGSYADNPSEDNDGDDLVGGQLYWNSVDTELRFYNGAAWEAPSAQAATSATNALASENAAAASETQTGSDLAATNADVLTTNADADSTAADVLSTNADVTQTGNDALATNRDKNVTNTNKLQTGTDVLATAQDVLSTAADVGLTNADVVQTALDRTATTADVTATNADVNTTNADVVSTGNDATQTALDKVQTGAYSAASNANAVSARTAAEAAEASATLIGNEVTYAAEWASNDVDELVSTEAGGDGTSDYSAKHHAAKALVSAGEAAGTTIAGLDDVTMDEIEAGELILFDGDGYINATPTEAGLAVTTHTHVIEDITDFTDDSANWNTAHGWGNHDGLYQPLNTVLTATTASFLTGDATKLSDIAEGAEVNPALVTQAEAEAGTLATEKTFSALRVAQAIAALGVSMSDTDVKTAYENNAETNEFSDAEQTKLGGIATGAEVNDTTTLLDADIGVSVQAYDVVLGNTTASYLTTDSTKLGGIDTGAEVNAALITKDEAEAGTATTERTFSALRVAQAIEALSPPMSDADVKTAYENNDETNEFSDAEKTKLTGIATDADKLPDQAGNADKVLTTDGTTATWEEPSNSTDGGSANSTYTSIQRLNGGSASG